MQIKNIEQASAKEITHIFVQSWKSGYRGLVSDHYLDNLSEEELVNKWESWLDIVKPGFVAYVDDKAVGFISCGPIRTRPPGDRGIIPLYAAEVYAFYVHPDYWGQGLGKALLKQALESLKEQKTQSLLLWVIKKNKRALDFYEKYGGQRVGKVKKDIGGMQVEESAVGWRDISVPLDKLSAV